MKNTKGMTLIEVIISLLIISTASLIIVVGFVTALNLFTDSNHYKDVTNKQQKAHPNRKTQWSWQRPCGTGASRNWNA